MPSLIQRSSEHAERLMSHVNELSALADRVGAAGWAELRPQLAAEHEFLVSTLVPHMEAVESGVHRELDRLLSCRLSMEPMEREHVEVRKLIGQIEAFAARPSIGDAEAVELNRVLVKLHAILKIHLREESMYIPILERNLEPDQLDALAASLDHASRVEL